MFDAAKAAHKAWAKSPLWKRAELLHKVAALLRQHAQPMADCLVREVAKPAKDSLAEVVRSADLIDYTAEEGVRWLGEGQMLNSDSFPGQARNKLCLVSKVRELHELVCNAERIFHRLSCNHASFRSQASSWRESCTGRSTHVHAHTQSRVHVAC